MPEKKHRIDLMQNSKLNIQYLNFYFYWKKNYLISNIYG